MITLVLDSDKRIASACLPEETGEVAEGYEAVTVEDLPDTGLMNFRYVDGEFLYEPLIATESEKDSMETEVDHEYRLLVLEMGI